MARIKHNELTGNDLHEPKVHGIGGDKHTADTLSNLNTKISDANLDDKNATRPPSEHALGGSAHTTDTLANLNAKISGATLDDKNATRPPASHSNTKHTTALVGETGVINAMATKTTPVDADIVVIENSASTPAWLPRKLSWSNIKATLKTYFDAFYVALTGNQSIDGVKTFTSFPVTPSSAPTTDYQVANKKYVDDIIIPNLGMLPAGDDGSIGIDTWDDFSDMLMVSVNSGTTFSEPIVSTYVIPYTGGLYDPLHRGGVLALNGDIHFIPSSARVGQKINKNGDISTYSLVYTTWNAYCGGVISPNGDIHFVPSSAQVGQKVDKNGIVSTYSLIYAIEEYAYSGGVLAPNGDIHFVPDSAEVGQKVNKNGVVSTYSLLHTATNAYKGGIVTFDGDIYFIPSNTSVGQKIKTLSAKPFSEAVCLSPFLNKL